MSTSVTQLSKVSAERARMVDRNLELAGEFGQTVFADPSVLDELPSGSTLVFLPDDDPEFAEANIDIGLQALRRGENVYFCHVRRSSDGRLIFETPAMTDADEDGDAER